MLEVLLIFEKYIYMDEVLVEGIMKMEKGRIIFLNGVTSAGKTSIVDALQNRDDVFFHVVANDLFQQMLDILKDNPLDIVEVYCPLEICRQRNIIRGDRFETQSEEQYYLMADNIKYSTRVDTSQYSPDECADIIVRKLLLTNR